MDAPEQARRIIGPQVCRALLASAIEVKKKGAAEIEATVNLCMQRDERSAMHALDTIMQTLESQFLGLQSLGIEPGTSPLQAREYAPLPGPGVSNSHEIGGMMALLGVYRANPATADRVSAALTHVHQHASDISVVYYASECIYNLLLSSEQSGINPPDFASLFGVVTRLWLQEKEPRLKQACNILDRAVRDLGRRQSIDVRELLLRNKNLPLWSTRCPEHLLPWLELLMKNNDEHGLALLGDLLDLICALRGALPTESEKTLTDHCKRLGELLSRDSGDSVVAASDMVDLYAQGTNLRLTMLREITAELAEQARTGLKPVGEESLVQLTCYTLCAPHFDHLIPETFDVDKRDKWLTVLFRDPLLSLSEAAWAVVLNRLDTEAAVPEPCVSALARHLISSDTAPETLERYAPLLQTNREIWRHLLTGPDLQPEICERVARLLHYISPPKNAALDILTICQSAAPANRRALELYLVFSLCLLLHPPVSHPDLQWSSQFLIRAAGGAPVALSTVVDTPTAFHDSAEALVFLLDYPAALGLRWRVLRTDFYMIACAWLTSDSPSHAIAQKRAQTRDLKSVDGEEEWTSQTLFMTVPKILPHSLSERPLVHPTSMQILQSLLKPNARSSAKLAGGRASSAVRMTPPQMEESVSPFAGSDGESAHEASPELLQSSCLESDRADNGTSSANSKWVSEPPSPRAEAGQAEGREDIRVYRRATSKNAMAQLSSTDADVDLPPPSATIPPKATGEIWVNRVIDEGPSSIY